MDTFLSCLYYREALLLQNIFQEKIDGKRSTAKKYILTEDSMIVVWTMYNITLQKIVDKVKIMLIANVRLDSRA